MSIEFSLTKRQAAGLQELIELATRGRDDFLYQAEFADYSRADIAAADLLWQNAATTAQSLVRQVEVQLAAHELGE